MKEIEKININAEKTEKEREKSINKPIKSVDDLQ